MTQTLLAKDGLQLLLLTHKIKIFITKIQKDWKSQALQFALVYKFIMYYFYLFHLSQFQFLHRLTGTYMSTGLRQMKSQSEQEQVAITSDPHKSHFLDQFTATAKG